MSNERDDSRKVREPVRTRVRSRRMGFKGPLHCPEELKEPGWHYEFIAVSADNPYQIMQKKRDGFQYVPKEHLEKYNIELGDSVITNSTFSDGTNICINTGAGTRSYLMRIPQNEYEQICKEELEEREADRKQRIDGIKSLPGVYEGRPDK